MPGQRCQSALHGKLLLLRCVDPRLFAHAAKQSPSLTNYGPYQSESSPAGSQLCCQRLEQAFWQAALLVAVHGRRRTGGKA
jgi:hypothetical protein